MEKKYKTNGFSQVGTNHGSDEKNNQDATISGSNERFEVIALADGVSSCKKGGEGARITVECIKNYLLENGENLMNMPDEERNTEISEAIKSELMKQAEQDGLDMKEYASTLATILVDKKLSRIMSVSVGDSLIVGVKGNNVYIVTMPADSRQGIPTTVDTDFKNEFFKSNVIEAKDGELVADSFIAYSDGAWKELYHRGKLKSEIKEMILSKNYTGLSEYLKSRNTFDDCTFIALDIEKVIEKGELSALEVKKDEKLKLEDEARKISKIEKEIDKVESNKDFTE